MARSYAVAGGGMAGMFYAAEAKRRDPTAHVHLIESAPSLGGTYNSIRYPGDRIFDYGMHLFYEACDERVDRVLREVLRDEEWHFWEGNRKDIAGLFWRGRLQTGSHYPDLRRVADRPSLLGDLFENLHSDDWTQATDCAAYFRQKFGEGISETVFRPAQRKLWHAEPEALDPFALRMVSSDRVVLFDHELMLDLMKSQSLRSRLAVPDQLRLPEGARASRQRALYPKRYGFSAYIDRFRERLVQSGVEVHTTTRIEAVSSSGQGKPTLQAKHADGAPLALELDHLFWAAPLMQLPQAMKLPMENLPMDVPHHVGYAHFVLDRPPKMGELYYCYCYDAPLKAFRVTNYTAYCPGSAANGYALCVEMHYSGADKPPEKSLVMEEARRELATMGIVTPSHAITFTDAHVSRFGFPRPTLRNRQAFSAIRARVSERIPSGITVGGVAPDLGRFFLQDILGAAADQLDAAIP